MLQIDRDIRFLVGDKEIFDTAPAAKVLEAYNDSVLAFLEELSSRLLKNSALRKYPDIMAYGFWIRRRNLENLGERYKNNQLKMGRGVAFHITPSNIPIQFAVSLVYGLLSGNINIIRISDKEFVEVDIICRTINEILAEEEFEYLKRYICIIRYGHNDEVTKQLSSICDARIIWGGDNTINSIRRFNIPPRAVELCFADRDSICLIDSDKYLLSDHRVLAKDFYNDTYYVDQNACSSPRIIIWLGGSIKEAKEIFWHTLSSELDNYDLPPVAGSEKLLKFCTLAAKDRDVSYIADSMKLVRIGIKHISDDLLDYKSGMGYFFEYTAKKLEEIVPLLRKSCQTVSFYGVNPDCIKELIWKYGVRGVDRIVPMGHAQELSLEWDGFDMIEGLSRKISS